jgi:hypothetical protein
VTFTVGAQGAVPFSYQWLHAGTNLPGATTRTLSILSAYYTDAGTYAAHVSNNAGSTNSQTATLVVQAPPSFANLTNALVLHLPFDGSFADTSGRTNNANPVNSPAFVPGRIGAQAISVNTDPNSSTYNYVQIVDTNTSAPYPDLEFADSDSFSIAYWVKYTGFPNDLPIVGNAQNSTYQTGWVFTDEGGQLEWTLVGTTGQSISDPVSGSPVINDGSWHSTVVTFDRASATAVSYVDGKAVNSKSIAGVGGLATGLPICLGQDTTGTYGVAGSYVIDDLGIWRRALTPAEAVGIYAAGQIGQSFDVQGPMRLNFNVTSSGLELIWQAGTLESVDALGGTWQPVNGASAPYYKAPLNLAKKFYHVKF